MSIYKKIAICIISLFLFVILVNIGLNYWIKKQLPIIIDQKNKTAYHINYEKIEVSLWSRNIYAQTLLVHPKNQLENSKIKTGIFSKIESITIKHFNIWDLAFRDIIQAESITINKARVILYKKDEKLLNNRKSIKTEIIEPFRKIIAVSNIYLNEGSVDVVSLKNDKPILSIKNIILKLEGILISDATLKEKIPMHFEKYVLICDSLYYKPNAFYHLNIGKISTENRFLRIRNFSYLPEFNRKEFVQKLNKEKDIYTIKLDSADIEKMDWGFKNERFFFKAKSIVANHVDANIYRNKIPKDDLSKKYLYNALLRKIKFPLQIDTIQILKSKLVYEEEIDFSKGPGILNFDHFNMQVTNLKSGFGITKAPDVKIKVNCQFMKTSPLNVNWSFNVLDQKDSFHIQGTISNFNVVAMERFTKPYINTSFTGKFNKYHFNFYGNDNNAKGNATLDYEDLKVKLFKKNDREKEAKLKTAVANLLLKNDSGDKSKKADVELDRIPEKSFYNFLWRSIAESLKKILI
ncbi:hypothetical protein C8C83_2409 [Flavobacterium sp. 90]|uniref:hypothetical protein n=1 Tax=unclassified Flavobacterium TaxID=196869 RepID=UPI000EB52559|nr:MULTISPECIES: hypothetical protein [unclassified Flavobacterium]RKR10730.1 hypothetical protein C8C82_2715 [Flavobacterium sp. 81]TCK54513.1 hypothetical protein C8C83_2409 [Flavobacterium sp. 90]